MTDFQFFFWEVPPVKGILRESMGVNEGSVGDHRDTFAFFRANLRSIDSKIKKKQTDEKQSN